MIPRDTIDEIKSRTDIFEIIGDFVQLKKSGSSYRGLSPFNNERTPSFYVVPHKNFFKDFSSGKSGDAITFLMEHEGMNYVEALKFLAQRYNITIEEKEATPEMEEEQSERESILIAMRFANDTFQQNLREHEEGKSLGLSYLKERKLTPEVTDAFQLGYSLNQWQGFYETAQKAGYQPEILEKAGLIVQQEQGNKVYDRFRGRVMFPIHDLSGRPIAFGARLLGKDKKQAKYLNSPETPVYHKSDVLYGIYQAKQAIRNEANCYLVEGYTDVISLHQFGVKNVVASSGTALTEAQIRLLKRFTSTVSVIFDGDSAGLQAAFRGIDMLLENNLDVKAVALSEGEDPDNLAHRLRFDTAEHLEQETVDFMEFKIKVLADEASGDPARQTAMVHEIVSSISKIPDAIKRSVYTKACSRQLNIAEDVLIAEQNRLIIGEARKNNRQQSQDKVSDEDSLHTTVEDILEEEKEADSAVHSVLSLQEQESIRILLNYGNLQLDDQSYLCEYILEEIAEIDFQTPIYAKILQLYRGNLERGVVTTAGDLKKSGDEPVQQAVINMEAREERYQISESWMSKYKIYVPNETDALDSTVFKHVLRLKYRVTEQLMNQLAEDLKNKPSEEDQLTLMRGHMELNKVKQELAKQLGIVIG
jgi:DNA primase